MKLEFKRKKGFTLIEMLVVLGIIGILAAVLMGTFSGGTDSAKTATCLSNMRNLAAACQSAGVALGHYPTAGSLETITVTENNGKARKQYNEIPGWISWNSQGAYRRDSSGYLPNAHKSSSAWNTSMYEDNEETRKYCLTNGVLWKYLAGNHNCYLCPLHVIKQKKLNPNWSYCMNAYFKWDSSKGKTAVDASDPGTRWYGHIPRADKLLLFGEIPFVEHDGISVPEETSGEKCDAILQHKNCKGVSTPESIGFNHKSGKQYYGNIVFADGHTEKLVYPKQGLSDAEVQDLTMWLCGWNTEKKTYTGVDVSFNGKKYEKMTN